MWSADGTLLPGWPRKLASIFGHVAVDDLDGDGRNEIIVAGTSIVVVDANGVALPGWPRRPGSSLLGAPAIGDIDGDGQKEIVVRGDLGAEPDLRLSQPTGRPCPAGRRT